MSEIISKIIGITLLAVSAVIFGKIILDEKITNKKRSIVVIIVCISAWILSVTYLSQTIKTIAILLICIFLYKNIFKLDTSKAILTSLVYAMILMLADGFYTTIVIGFFNIKIDFYYSHIVTSIFSNAIVSIMCLLITLLLRKYVKKFLKLNPEFNITIVILSILTCLCVTIFFYDAFSNITFNVEFFVNIGMILVFLFIIVTLIREKIENNKKITQYNESLKFLKVYEQQIETNRINNHETKNKFITIRSKMEDGSSKDDIIKYINQIVKDKTEFNKQQYSKFQYLPSNGLKALFYYKFSRAESLGISSNINISKDIENSIICNLTPKDFDEFVMILGVFLDNAIEASLQSETKGISLEMYMNEGQTIIVISNSYSNPIDKTKIGNISFSTKGKDRGHGVLLARKIINRNPLFEEETTITLEVYTQKLIVKDKTYTS